MNTLSNLKPAIELKKFRFAEFASEETNCYSAEVWVDGRPAFEASNGTAGCASRMGVCLTPLRSPVTEGIAERSFPTARPENNMDTISNSNPRFVWAVGAYREQFPDMPDNLGLVLWDRQEDRAVVTVHEQYAQAMCLETTRTLNDAPFESLASWFNRLSNPTLRSEGIAPTRSAVKTWRDIA